MISSVAGSGFFDYASYATQNAERGGFAANSTHSTGEEKEKTAETRASNASNDMAKKPNGAPLTDGDQAEIRELESIDRKVRQHEQAHMAAGGSLVTSSASYSYTEGPDGKRYATGGEVGIDTSSGRTPEETLSRARQIRSAALAPADPSPQDRSVAAAASQMEMQALQEIAKAQQEAIKSGSEGETVDLPEIPTPGSGQSEANNLSPFATDKAANDNGIGTPRRAEAATQAYQSMMFGAAQGSERESHSMGLGSFGGLISAYA
ncbi:hypothetical protein FACS1894101_0900 [Betaproteobacteria bacterium]|nr:hypothetical protein FACS1894101_0900 [Betaproteobacteria bacterium]